MEIDLEVNPGIIGGIVGKLIWRNVKIRLEEEVDGQRRLEEVRRGDEGSRSIVGPDKKKKKKKKKRKKMLIAKYT